MFQRLVSCKLLLGGSHRILHTKSHFRLPQAIKCIPLPLSHFIIILFITQQQNYLTQVAPCCVCQVAFLCVLSFGNYVYLYHTESQVNVGSQTI